MQRSRSSTLLVATTSLTLACGEPPPETDVATVDQALVDLSTCGPKNLALNTVGSGTPSPLESDATASGNPWDLLDSVTEYTSEQRGMLFEFGGTRQVTVDLGGNATLDDLTVWHHSDDGEAGHDIPDSVALEYFDGSAWQPITGFARSLDLAYPQPGSGFGSYPDSYSFPPVVGSKLRWSFDGDGPNVLLPFGNPPRPGDMLRNDAVAVATGAAFTCALRTSGQVLCWGVGDWGQLGNGDTKNSLEPVAVTGINNATAIAAAGSDSHSCAVLGSGEVACWGRGTRGQLGNGANHNSTVPVLVRDLTDAVDVAANLLSSCALRETGAVACWGRGSHGKLGNGDTANSNTPVPVAGLADAVALEAGLDHNCVVRSSGRVACWGRGSEGQLGDGQSMDSSTPVEVQGITDAVGVAGGATHSCALRQTGAVLCWGGLYTFNFGELGNGSTSGSSLPVSVLGLTDIVRISAAGYNTCGLHADGSVSCWGLSETGQLGNGSILNSSIPVPVPRLTGVTSLDSGASGSCVVRDAGTLACWGSAQSGRLGNGQIDISASPDSVLALSDAVQIAAGISHTCATRSTGEVACWGRNIVGPLGNGGGDNVASPVAVVGLNGVVGVTSQFAHNCALRGDGAVACWGLGDDGQLGDGNTSGSATPVGVLGLSDAVAVAAGVGHSCALRETGQLLCWGSNAYGQLGLGSTVPSLTPALVDLANVSLVAAGYYHTCAVYGASDVACWGRGGRLGHGSASGSNVPVTVNGIGDVAEIQAGPAHTCVVQQDGQVLCWGDNEYGQIGDGSTQRATSPKLVSGLPSATSVAPGFWHTCALLQTGQVMCWGHGQDGELGDGNATNSTTPVLVSGLDDAVAITAGVMHNCAVRSSGNAVCWGSSSYGSLGNGDFGFSASPVSVSSFAGTPWQAWPYEVTVNGCPEIAAPESGSETSAPAGGSVTTDPEGDGATLADPVETQVTTPTGGTVSIQEEPLEDEPPLNAFQLFDQQVVISAPDAELATDPLVLTFTIDASLLPPGADADDVEVFRNSSLVGDCVIPGFASPDPCIASRELVNGDVVITVLTTEASVWTFGVALDSDLDGDGTLDFYDECAETLDGAVVDEDGCAVSQLCPCEGSRGSSEPWRNHGQYVECVAAAVESFVAEGLLSETEGEAVVASAGRSTCGRD